MFELSLFWGPSIVKLFMNPRGGLFPYMLCMLTGRVRLVSKPFIYLKSLEELSRYRNGDPWDQLLLGSFRSIPQPHESLAILPGEPTELATLSCSTRRLVSLCCGGQRFCCLRPSFMGNPGGKMNCVIGARWKKWPRATCNLWAHNVDLATMFFFPLSLSIIGCCAPDLADLKWFVYCFWRCEDAPLTGISPPKTSCIAHHDRTEIFRCYVGIPEQSLQGCGPRSFKIYDPRNRKRHLFSILPIECSWDGCHFFWYLPGIIWNWMWGPSIPIDHIYIVITDSITICTTNIIIPSISLINQQDSTTNYIDIYTYI